MFNQDKAGVTYAAHTNGPVTTTISSYIDNVIIPFENTHSLTQNSRPLTSIAGYPAGAAFGQAYLPPIKH